MLLNNVMLSVFVNITGHFTNVYSRSLGVAEQRKRDRMCICIPTRPVHIYICMYIYILYILIACDHRDIFKS